jgi:hypothetical protein
MDQSLSILASGGGFAGLLGRSRNERGYVDGIITPRNLKGGFCTVACTKNQTTAVGTKRTVSVAALMVAFDPKRTLRARHAPGLREVLITLNRLDLDQRPIRDVRFISAPLVF